MNNIRWSDAIAAEWMKLKHLHAVTWSATLFVFMPLMLAFMLYLGKTPEMATSSGMFSMKTGMFVDYEWNGFFMAVLQAGAGLGMVGSGFVISFVFGREYSENTMKDLLALPTQRWKIVSAKFIISFMWSLLLLMVMLLVVLVSGWILDLQAEVQLVWDMSMKFMLMSLMTVMITAPFAILASVFKGIMAPLAACIIALIVGNLVTTIGMGPFFPWTIPALSALAFEDPGMNVGIIGNVIYICTLVAGIWGTIKYWQVADHHG